jgi:hypothetical protein
MAPTSSRKIVPPCVCAKWPGGAFRKPLPYLYARTMPFLVILACGVLAITYLDVLTTGVVRFFAG